MAERTADDAAKVLAAIAAEIDHVTDSELAEAGHVAIALILDRTQKGLDAELKPFAPYASDYAIERAQQGLSIQPDLRRTGQMLGALVPKVAGGAVRIEFVDPLDATKAAANNDGVDTSAPRTDSKKPSRRVAPAHRKTPAREFVDVRANAELDAVGQAIVNGVVARVEKKTTP